MFDRKNLNGLYVISDDILTPPKSLYENMQQALEGGAKIVQLRNKTSSLEMVEEQALMLQALCKQYNALFVLNDCVQLAIKHQFDGLHIGKSDYEQLPKIREAFKGILGVSCYDSITKAKECENLGVDYVAFGSFFPSSTKPSSQVIALEVLLEAKQNLTIPICAIGGIDLSNLNEVLYYKPDLIAVISDMFCQNDIKKQASTYVQLMS